MFKFFVSITKENLKFKNIFTTFWKNKTLILIKRLYLSTKAFNLLMNQFIKLYINFNEEKDIIFPKIGPKKKLIFSFKLLFEKQMYSSV